MQNMETVKLIKDFKAARNNGNDSAADGLFARIFAEVKPDIINTIRKDFSLYMGTYGEDMIQAAALGLFQNMEMFHEDRENFGLFVRTVTESSCKNFIRQIGMLSKMYKVCQG